MTRTISARRVVLADRVATDAEVVVDGGVIEEIRPASGDPTHDLLVAGFVDVQVNGIGDLDVWHAHGDDWSRLDELSLAQGVTTWLPTLVTARLDDYPAALARIARAVARPGLRPAIAGVHLEGPFLGGAPGAHRRDHVVDVDLAWLDRLPTIVRMVTLAPEAAGALDATRLLAGRGVVVSLGHSLADAPTARAAFDAGARSATHLFNAMAPLHHRDPGIVAAALLDDRVAVGVIADGVHLHADVISIVARVVGMDRLVAVTDSVAWRAGSAGPVALALRDGAPRLPDGTLAGSMLRMDAAFRAIERATGSTLAAAAACAANPARLLGLADRGVIAPGARGDLVALDGDGVAAVWLGGEHVASAGPGDRSAN